MLLYVITLSNKKGIKPLKSFLESHGFFNIHKKIISLPHHVLIYTLIPEQSIDVIANIDAHLSYGQSWSLYEFEQPKSRDWLTEIVSLFFDHNQLHLPPELLCKVPKKWSIYTPMVMFSPGWLETDAWKLGLGQNYFHFCHHLTVAFSNNTGSNITHIAVNQPISNTDIMRRPENITPIYGDFGVTVDTETPSRSQLDLAFWCWTVQNGIHQTWCPKYTMFSRGNIKEKKRVLDNFPHLQGSYVLDYYAGIGYFTLSYAKNGARVICWEINPWSIEALARNCDANNLRYKMCYHSVDFDDVTQVYIVPRSNETCQELLGGTKLPISHINLGLLPSSQPSWPLTTWAVREVSTTKPMVHVHENVHVNSIDEFGDRVKESFCGDVVETTKVKTFAPDVWHVVYDVEYK